MLIWDTEKYVKDVTFKTIYATHSGLNRVNFAK